MRLVMMGTGTFAEPTFEALLSNFPGDVVGLVTQPPRDAGNKRGSTRQTVTPPSLASGASHGTGARRPASAEDVLQAADAVETLWEELTPT